MAASTSRKARSEARETVDDAICIAGMSSGSRTDAEHSSSLFIEQEGAGHDTDAQSARAFHVTSA